MLVHMAVHYPKAGKEAQLIASMERFGAAVHCDPALLLHRTLRDRKSGRLVGLAVWRDESAWLAGVDKQRQAVEGDPLDAWWERPPDVFVLDDVAES